MLTVGELAGGSINDATPDPGSLVLWRPSSASLAKVGQAPISAVPLSIQQEGQLLHFHEYAARGVERPRRLLILSWDIAGQCDIDAMTHVLNAHLRRHDTYHSWFKFTDDNRCVRHTISDPSDIELVPQMKGEVTADQWRSLALSTPSPDQWSCFNFMIIQRGDHFTFYACVDHLLVDGMFFGVAINEIHMMYTALVEGEGPIRLPAAGSYDDYCVRQREHLSTMTLESPEIRQWIEFADNNGETLPGFPLPLGEISPTPAFTSAQLLDERQTARFESACIAAGARFSGGVFACAALAHYELTGADTYYGMAAAETRRTPADFMTTGSFGGDIPITVPIAASSFVDTVRAAQASLDAGHDLADVPFGYAVMLEPRLRHPQGFAPMLFFLDAGCPPIVGLFSSQAGRLNFSYYVWHGFGGELAIRIYRLETETHVIMQYPDNPVAHDSVTRYIAALKSVYARVADGYGALPAPGAGAVVR